MQAKLYQITPYNITDNNFYNFKSQTKFNKFLDKIEPPTEKEVSIVKLESYNKIMYKLQFNSEQEEKIFCGFKYIIVDNKYWFITNFDVKKNNKSGFITYYAQLDHWATQWLKVKKHVHTELKSKNIYIERKHQNRWRYYNEEKSLSINLNENSPYHIEEKLKINDYIPSNNFELKSDNFEVFNIGEMNVFNKCCYFLKWQLSKPIIINNFDNTTHKDFGVNYIFIFLNDKNLKYYLENFNPNFMSIFSTIDIKNYKLKKISSEIKEELSGFLKPNEDDEYISDLDFYKQDFSSNLVESIDIRDIPLNLVKKYCDYFKNIENELIFYMYPFSRYLFIKGNNMKEYKINNLLYDYSLDNSFTRKIKMKYLSFLSYNIYNLWIYPTSGLYFSDLINDKQFLSYGLHIPNNLEIPTTSNSYTTYAQNNLNTLQTNINQAEQTRQIANQEATTSLITSAVTTAIGVMLAPVTLGASLGLAAGGTAYMGLQTNKWVNNQIKNNFEVDSLNAKLNDMKNTPNTISSNNSDYYWLTYFNNNGYFDSDTEGNPLHNYSISQFLVSSISNIDKSVLFDWYYYNGYLFNRYTNDLHFDEYRNRYILNFYKIKDLKTLLATCPEICNEDIEWWNNTFAQGIIVWETEDSLNLYDEQIYIGNNKYENWETGLLKEQYVLEKIKEDRRKKWKQEINQISKKETRTLEDDQRLLKLLLKTNSRTLTNQNDKLRFMQIIENNIELNIKNPDLTKYRNLLWELKVLDLETKLEKINPNEKIFESKSPDGFVYEGISLKVFYIIWRNNLNDKWRLVKYENKVVTKDIVIDQYNNNILYISEGNSGKSALIIKENSQVVRNFYEEKNEDYFKLYMYNGEPIEAPNLTIDNEGNLKLFDITIKI